MSFLKYINVTEKGMAFDPRTGESFQLNESGEFILRLLQKEEKTETIAKKLSNEYQISLGKALSDVLEFQVQLRIFGLSE